jgi:hypothetical protein
LFTLHWNFFYRYTYEAGPVFTLIENYMIKKLLEIMEFPADGDGVFVLEVLKPICMDL